jgi:HEAT repeat protein
MNTNKPVTSVRAIYALGFLGPNALPPLVLVASNSQTMAFAYREAAVNSILNMGYLGTNAHTVVPVLIGCLHEGDAMTELAMRALLLMHVETDVTVLAVADSLQNTNAHLRQCAAECLAIAGPLGRPALPALLRALQDPEIYVRTAATNSLRRIAPEMLRESRIEP